MNHSIYIHIPFCLHRCNYCDFATTEGLLKYIPDYVQALIEEFRIVSNQKITNQIHSIYFGGGTPSLLTILQIQALLRSLKSSFYILDDCEITFEANPGTLTPKYLNGLKDLGITRISMGVQSTNLWDLERLDRIHRVEDIIENIRAIRKAGFENVNFDLVYGLPWQDFNSWKHNIDRAIELNPDHFSLYSLIIEEGTAIFNWHQRGLFGLKSQDLEGDMYEYSIGKLRMADYVQYEISNWAKSSSTRDFRCRHNLQYWLNESYLGFGAGAHGYVHDFRTINTINPVDYISRMKFTSFDAQVPAKSPANISSCKVERLTQMKDHMLMGLRLTQLGVNSEQFICRYDASIDEVFESEIGLLLGQGLVEWGQGKECLRLSKRGVMVANQVFRHFV
jgi:oxygen-independent coproporphyrinogen-3 oxidase